MGVKRIGEQVDPCLKEFLVEPGEQKINSVETVAVGIPSVAL